MNTATKIIIFMTLAVAFASAGAIITYKFFPREIIKELDGKIITNTRIEYKTITPLSPCADITRERNLILMLYSEYTACPPQNIVRKNDTVTFQLYNAEITNTYEIKTGTNASSFLSIGCGLAYSPRSFIGLSANAVVWEIPVSVTIFTNDIIFNVSKVWKIW